MSDFLGFFSHIRGHKPITLMMNINHHRKNNANRVQINKSLIFGGDNG